AKPVSAVFKEVRDSIYRLGNAAEHLGASEILRWKTGKEFAPCLTCDLEAEKATIEVLVEANAKNLLKSAHDCSTGGLAVTLAESLLSASNGLGATIDLSGLNRNFFVELFAETAPRILV